MGVLVRMVRQFPSSLPHYLVMYFDCYHCEYYYYYFYFYYYVINIVQPSFLFCNRSENGINKYQLTIKLSLFFDRYNEISNSY